MTPWFKETPVLESLFNKVAGIQACNFIEKGVQQIELFSYKSIFFW